MIKETEKIGVLNYNENIVSLVVAPDKSYSFDPSIDGETPTIISMSIDEIRYANNFNAFRNGMLFFEESKAEDVYNILGIKDWKNILTNKDIREIILHPTYEGLEKLIAIKDSAMFERVRAAYQKLKMEDTHDISIRVVQIINTRYKELLNRQINTSIVLTKKDVPETINSAEVNDLKAQNAAMQEQMSQMQALIEKLMASQQGNTQSDTEKKPKRTTNTSSAKKTS